jgi:hypothetical protein
LMAATLVGLEANSPVERQGMGGVRDMVLFTRSLG